MNIQYIHAWKTPCNFFFFTLKFSGSFCACFCIYFCAINLSFHQTRCVVFKCLHRGLLLADTLVT